MSQNSVKEEEVKALLKELIAEGLMQRANRGSMIASFMYDSVTENNGMNSMLNKMVPLAYDILRYLVTYLNRGENALYEAADLVTKLQTIAVLKKPDFDLNSYTREDITGWHMEWQAASPMVDAYMKWRNNGGDQANEISHGSFNSNAIRRRRMINKDVQIATKTFSVTDLIQTDNTISLNRRSAKPKIPVKDPRNYVYQGDIVDYSNHQFIRTLKKTDITDETTSDYWGTISKPNSVINLSNEIETLPKTSEGTIITADDRIYTPSFNNAFTQYVSEMASLGIVNFARNIVEFSYNEVRAMHIFSDKEDMNLFLTENGDVVQLLDCKTLNDLYATLKKCRPKFGVRNAAGIILSNVNMIATDLVNRKVDLDMGLPNTSIDDFSEDYPELMQHLNNEFGEEVISQFVERFEHSIVIKSTSFFSFNNDDAMDQVNSEHLDKLFGTGISERTLFIKKLCYVTYIPIMANQLLMAFDDKEALALVNKYKARPLYDAITGIFERMGDSPYMFDEILIKTIDSVTFAVTPTSLEHSKDDESYQYAIRYIV